MEKLQQALAKAREKRTSVVGEGPTTLRPGARPTTDGLWAELPEMTLQKPALIRNRIVTVDAGPNATPFDILRTKVLLQMRKNGWRWLAITSPTAACGKTTMACNLAVGLSRQPDIRTLLVELDLRRPSMAKLLACEPAHDVTEMLTGKVQFEEQALRIRSNVAVSMARRPSSDPTRYMFSTETPAVLNKVVERYRPDIVIFDLPPLLVGDDTRAFLSNVDCALMVTRAEKTTISQIDTSEREIAEHTNVLGVVLNQCRHIDDMSTYGYDEA